MGPAAARRGSLAKRRRLAPYAVVKPRPRIGCADRLQPEEIADGALQPQCRRMTCADAREFAGSAIKAHDGNLAALGKEAQMHGRCFAPETEQRELARGEQVDRFEPSILADIDARPRSVGDDHFMTRDRVEQAHASHPNSFATLEKPTTRVGGK